MTYRPVPRYGVREIVPGIKINGCSKAQDVPHGVGHNAVCICACAWCEEERAATSAAPAQLTMELA